ncbi:hypothetical protein F4677DRAFT_307170 [Hypoxylon crocopeplum]|nr:hypothetical protein F4677DRAFT_307170 [Hypoxylon crocopeplum]
MADFGWLRLGQHSRTPTTPLSPPSPGRGPPRVPSHLSLDSRTSIPPDLLTSRSDASASLLVREQDKIWYNPSLEQMVETLQVVIMTQGVLRPIPVDYNSYVLHLIEGFANSQERIRTADAAHGEAKYSLEHHLEHFKSVADEWLERENQYKAEIKRLEVLLSRTSRDGLEAVTLARTNSVVDRTGPQAKQFVSTLKRLSTITAQDTPTSPSYKIDRCGSKPAAKVLDKDNDFLISNKIRRHDEAARVGMAYARGKKSRHVRAAAPRPSQQLLLAEKMEKPTSPSNDPVSQPLFSDDIYDTSEMYGKTTMEAREPAVHERQVGRQILEDLLDCEGIGGDDTDARSQSSDPYELASKHGLNQASESMTIRDLDSRHTRGLSGFSFVPGDDTFPSDDNVIGYAAGKNKENDNELWQCEGLSSRRPGKGGVEGWIDGVRSDPAANILTPSKSWERRLSPAVETTLPLDFYTSSVGTVVRAAKETPGVATNHDSYTGVGSTTVMAPSGDTTPKFGPVVEITIEGVTARPRQRAEDTTSLRPGAQ